MKHETFLTLYQAHLGNVDKNALMKARSREEDPFHQHVIGLMLEENRTSIPWDVAPFTTDFRTAPARERLDETVFAFVLRLVDIIKEEMYLRSFQKPESYDAVLAWLGLFKSVLTCSLALLYDVRWNDPSQHKALDEAMLKFFVGKNPSVLRELMTRLGVPPARESLYPAERDYEKLNFLHVGQYSSFYWRFLHWMAEAVKLRKDEFYKTEWRNLILGSLYRTLRCAICMYHFRQMVDELKDQLLDKESDFPKLWFDMHNRVHEQRRKQYVLLNEPDYTEAEYEEDRAYMLQALLP